MQEEDVAFWKPKMQPTEKLDVNESPPAPAPAAPAPPPPEAPPATHPAVRQSLGRETTVTGKLSFNAPTRIDGILNGEVKATDLLVIGEEGLVDGAVRAQQLLVLGVVRGDVHVDEKVEISETGKVIGSVRSKKLVVKAGGLLDGECHITGTATAKSGA